MMIKSCKFIDNISHGKQKIAICLIFASFFSFSCWSRRTEADVQAYIERYRLLALEHEMTFHIPACITLAQGLLESDAGQSELASKYNNHFGIKSFNWRGQVACYGDSSRRSCYRVYGTSEDSFLDHAKFLRGSRYDSLYRLDIGDYRAWAEGLRRCGYAEDHAYPQKLISIIERYHLNELSGVSSPGALAAAPKPEADKRARQKAERAAQKAAEQERRHLEQEQAKQRKHEKEEAQKQQREQERQQRMAERKQLEQQKQAQRDRERAEREQQRRERAERYAARKAQAEQAKHLADAEAAKNRASRQAARSSGHNAPVSNASADND